MNRITRMPMVNMNLKRNGFNMVFTNSFVKFSTFQGFHRNRILLHEDTSTKKYKMLERKTDNSVKFGYVDDYLSTTFNKFENPNNKIELDCVELYNGAWHYWIAGTGALAVCLLAALSVVFQFLMLSFYSTTDGNVVINRTNMHPYFKVNNGIDAKPMRQPLTKYVAYFSLQPSDQRQLFYNEIEWAIKERKIINNQRETMKTAIKKLLN